jgi:hypothetical protein
MVNLQVAAHVRHQTQGSGGVVILDTAGGKWLALNATAGDFWRAWDAGADFDEVLCEVAARHPQVPLDTLRADGERLMGELVEHGLLTADRESAPRDPKREPDTAPLSAGGVGSVALMAEIAPPAGRVGRDWLRGWLALCVLVTACLVVRFSSFRLQLALVRATRRWCHRAAASGEAKAVVAAVGWAVRRYPGRAACLEQSLAAVLLAAVARRRLDWCLGALTDPYRFHAWVEAEGHPVSTWDDPPSPLGYVRLLSA